METRLHLFRECSFTKAMWRESLFLLGQQVSWMGDLREGDFLKWWQSRVTKALRSIPLIILWGVWLAINVVIFNDQTQAPPVIAIKVVGIAGHFTQLNLNPRIHNIQQERINLEIPCGFLDGVVVENPSLCGDGATLYLTEHNYVTFKEGLGEGTNNFVELCTLRLLLIKTIEWGCRSLQIFGDSMIVINWTTGILRCHNIRLLPILLEMFFLKHHFLTLYPSFMFYRERNRLADKLSKEGSQHQEGQIIIETFLRDPGRFYMNVILYTLVNKVTNFSN